MSKSKRGRSYDRYFEGYTPYRDPKTHKIKRIYTDDYYGSTLTGSARIRRKLLYAGLFVVSVLLWLCASLSEYTMLPGFPTTLLSVCIAAAVMAFLLELISVLYACTAPLKMTIQKYKEACVHLKQASAFAMIILILSACMEVLSFLVNLSSAAWQALVVALAYLGSAAASGIIWYLEAHTEYIRIPNPAQTPKADI